MSGERTFSIATRSVVAALAEALLAERAPGGGLRPPDGQLIDRVVAGFDDWVGHGSETMPRLVAALLWSLEAGPAVFGHPARMSRLSLEDRLAYFERLEGSPVGMVATGFAGVKVPIILLGYESGERLAATGFDRPTLASRRTRLPVAQARGGAS